LFPADGVVFTPEGVQRARWSCLSRYIVSPLYLQISIGVQRARSA
jgi:hypothetical protein